MTNTDKFSEYKAELSKPTLSSTLEVLRQGEPNRPDAILFYGLSDLIQSEIDLLRPVWEGLTPAYRRSIMREFVEASEANNELNYRAVGIFALDDPDPGVREAAVEVLWEDTSLELMSRLIEMARYDAAPEVRAAAVAALGRFILMGELEELPEQETILAQDAAIYLLSSSVEQIAVKRRALEAIANCGHEIVPDAIMEAYESPEYDMRVSAVFAMGRTCDERWEQYILHEIEHGDAEMRYEAARASGELTLSGAVPGLAKLAMGVDREIQEVAIWSLGEIATNEAKRILDLLAEKAEEDEDVELLQAIEDAIANAAFLGADDLWAI
jgi:HEAT repeat protein